MFFFDLNLCIYWNLKDSPMVTIGIHRSISLLISLTDFSNYISNSTLFTCYIVCRCDGYILFKRNVYTSSVSILIIYFLLSYNVV